MNTVRKHQIPSKIVNVINEIMETSSVAMKLLTLFTKSRKRMQYSKRMEIAVQDKDVHFFVQFFQHLRYQVLEKLRFVAQHGFLESPCV